jgi:hypothetical protein
MSDNEEKIPGHSPAMVVGGMRVSNPKVQHEKEVKEEMTKEEKSIQHKQREKSLEKMLGAGSLVSGAHFKIEDVNPPNAIKSFHEKPMPTHNQYQYTNIPPDVHIFQPSRNTDLAPRTYVYQPGK